MPGNPGWAAGSKAGTTDRVSCGKAMCSMMDEEALAQEVRWKDGCIVVRKDETELHPERCGEEEFLALFWNTGLFKLFYSEDFTCTED